jgi:hypothetical protein
MEIGYGGMEWFRTVYRNPERHDSYVIYWSFINFRRFMSQIASWCGLIFVQIIFSQSSIMLGQKLCILFSLKIHRVIIYSEYMLQILAKYIVFFLYFVSYITLSRIFKSNKFEFDGLDLQNRCRKMHAFMGGGEPYSRAATWKTHDMGC